MLSICRTMPESIKRHVGVFLVGSLIFSLALAIAGFIASYDARQRMAGFASDIHTVTGTITNKRIADISNNHVYWLYNVSRNQIYSLDVSFQTEDGNFHYQSTDVSPTTYNVFGVGSTIKVTYVRSNPELFYVANDVPTYQDTAIFAAMFQYGTIASLLLLIFLAANVFWDRDGRSQVDQTASRQSGEGSLRPPRPQPRMGFGKRH